MHEFKACNSRISARRVQQMSDENAIEIQLSAGFFSSILQTKRNVFQHCHHRSVCKHSKHQHSWAARYTSSPLWVCVCVCVVFSIYVLCYACLKFHHSSLVSCSRHFAVMAHYGRVLACEPCRRVSECAFSGWFYGSWEIDKVISNYNTQSFPSLPLFSFLLLLPSCLFSSKY